MSHDLDGDLSRFSEGPLNDNDNDDDDNDDGDGDYDDDDDDDDDYFAAEGLARSTILQPGPPVLNSKVTWTDESHLEKPIFTPNSTIYRNIQIVTRSHEDHENPWIRLLQIKPAISGQPIHCKLLKRRLWDAGQYLALSYSWGDGEHTEQLFVDAQSLQVTPVFVSLHLLNALRRIRTETNVVNVWVDAMCINQADDMERSEQVHIMAQIFNQASEVRIWIGETERSIDESGNDTDFYLSLCRINKPWWTRLWIVQECAYAESCPIVMVGDITMNFDEFIDRWEAVISSAVDLQHTDEWLLDTHFKLLYTPFEAWKAQTRENKVRKPLFYRLQQTVDRICTDRHDKIYALLSLIEEQEARRLRPNYRRPFSELLLDVAEVVENSPHPVQTDDSLWQKLCAGEPHLEMALSDTTHTPKQYSNALHATAHLENHRLVRRLLQRVGEKSSEYRMAVLREAASRCSLLTVKLLLDDNKFVNLNQPDATEALEVSARHGHKEIVQLLLQSTLKMRLKNAFESASSENELDVIRLVLLERPDTTDIGDALVIASSRNHSSIVQLLLEHKSGQKFEKEHPAATLLAAVSKGHTSLVELLIVEYGINADVEDELYGHALQAAALEGHPHVVELLLKYGARADASGGHHGNALQAASRNGHLEVVQMLLQAGVDSNQAGGRYHHALQAASCGPHPEVIRLLLKHGAHPDTDGGVYVSPLYEASERGFADVVKILIDAGANVNLRRGPLDTALQVASYIGHLKVVRLLIQAGADVNANGGHLGTALQAASFNRHGEIMEFLVAKGADVNAKGGFYGNALQAASVLQEHEGRGGIELSGNVITYGIERHRVQIENLEFLLRKGAKIDAKGGYYTTALEAARRSRNKDTREVLEKRLEESKNWKFKMPSWARRMSHHSVTP